MQEGSKRYTLRSGARTWNVDVCGDLAASEAASMALQAAMRTGCGASVSVAGTDQKLASVMPCEPNGVVERKGI